MAMYKVVTHKLGRTDKQVCFPEEHFVGAEGFAHDFSLVENRRRAPPRETALLLAYNYFRRKGDYNLRYHGQAALTSQPKEVLALPKEAIHGGCVAKSGRTHPAANATAILVP